MYHQRELGDAAVSTGSRHTVVINVQIGPDQLDPEADEYVVTINGIQVLKLHPVRARRLGLLATEEPESADAYSYNPKGR